MEDQTHYSTSWHAQPKNPFEGTDPDNKKKLGYNRELGDWGEG